MSDESDPEGRAEIVRDMQAIFAQFDANLQRLAELQGEIEDLRDSLSVLDSESAPADLRVPWKAVSQELRASDLSERLDEFDARLRALEERP